MTAPDKEYSYDHLEQKIYINDIYYLHFSFYDHSMCGPAMYYISLVNTVTGIRNTLRVDSPVDDGLPCFFNDEIVTIMKLALKNPKNRLTPIQILCCLGLVHHFDETFMNAIIKEFHIDLSSSHSNVWDNLIIEPEPFVADPYSRYSGPYPSSLNQLYPIPNICNRKISIPYEIHPRYGRIIVDESYCDQCSVRSLDSSWNEEQKCAFADFSKFILS